MKRIVTFLFIIFSLSLITTVDAADVKLQDEIIYNIIVDRFNNGDQSLSEHIHIDDPYNYHGGDFVGIGKKLDHLEALGVSTIVLSPIMANATAGFHGYWVEDFYNINPNYGTEEEFHTLVEQAHDRGIKVIVEFVFNYASLTHSFVTDPTTKSWFKDRTFERNENETSLFWLDDVVQLDQENEDVQEYILDVAEHWMDKSNIDGFKLHAADQANMEYLETLTTMIKEKDPNFYLLAHVLDSSSDPTFLQEMETIDAVENYELFSAMIDVFGKVGTPVADLHETWETTSSGKDLLFTETKDTPRFANYVATYERNPLTTWKIALTYLYTTPGVPYMYQGNELQMFGLEYPETQQMMRFNSTDPDLEEFHDKLSTMRQEFPALTSGDYAQVGVSGGLSIFSRTLDNETVYVAINNDEIMQDVILTDISSDKQLRGLFEDEIVRSNQDGEFVVTMPRESIEVFVVQDNFGINWYYIAFVVVVFIIFFSAIFYLSRKQKLREQQNK